MIAIDGSFYRADVDGLIDEVPPEERTPFAAMAWFEPSLERAIDGPLAYADLLAELDAIAADPEASCALRIDGEFELIRARSVPRQHPPFRPLAEVVADQHVFEFTDVEGTVVGFRFPDYARGLEAEGYHLHFITADREHGGHVLDCRPARGHGARSTSRATCTSSCRPASSSTPRSSTPRPRRRSTASNTAADAALSRAGRPGRRSCRRAGPAWSSWRKCLAGSSTGSSTPSTRCTRSMWSRPSAGSRSPQITRAG